MSNHEQAAKMAPTIAFLKKTCHFLEKRVISGPPLGPEFGPKSAKNPKKFGPEIIFFGGGCGKGLGGDFSPFWLQKCPTIDEKLTQKARKNMPQERDHFVTNLHYIFHEFPM